MKKIALVLSACIITLIGFSQGSLGNNDPAAKKLLDDVSAKFKTFKSVQASFTFKNEDGKGATLGSKNGTVYMKGQKYRVNITGQEIFCDGSNIWTYEKAANEVTITKLDPGANGITPQKLFTDFYDKDFLSKLNGEKKVNKKVVQEIEMTPVDKTRPFHKVYLMIDKQNKTIYSTRVLDKTGNSYTYTVNTLNGKANLTDGVFVFDKAKYPGVDVIDLR
jgi:outer membrane lipoprotein-sorting protein